MEKDKKRGWASYSFEGVGGFFADFLQVRMGMSDNFSLTLHLLVEPKLLFLIQLNLF